MATGGLTHTARERAGGAISMSIRLGDEAPDFTAETTEVTIDFH